MLIQHNRNKCDTSKMTLEFFHDQQNLRLFFLRNGQVEHPDYCQLKDKNGKFRLCYYCRKTALRKPMIACDYCPLYWHLDCLPLASPPNPAKKWRCPHHIEHILASILQTLFLTFSPKWLIFFCVSL